MKILVTGGYGFIGSNFCNFWGINHAGQEDKLIVADALTYAARVGAVGVPHEFERVDLRDAMAVLRLVQKYKPDIVYHFAAESHVCRSIVGPRDFVTSNIVGTFNLLEAWRSEFGADPNRLFVHISTDEVFGELAPNEAAFTEMKAPAPRSPYAASKAASDHLVFAYQETYGLNVVVTNCSNNFGPHQHEEKLIPQTIIRFLRGEPARVFGNGLQVRDWLFVNDHCRALEALSTAGGTGRYCIGGKKELTNLQVIETIWRIMVEEGLVSGTFHVEHDRQARPTDDARYAVCTEKIEEATGWKPHPERFEENLRYTILWYARLYGKRAAGGAGDARSSAGGD